MKKLIVIADWVNDSLTCQEVKSAVEGFTRDPNQARISFVSSTPSTIHAAFLLSQVIETEERYGRSLETVIFANVDPRIQANESIEEAKGAEFIVIQLASGIYVCGPNAGYVYSMIKNKIVKVFIYKDLDKGSQFRSRDLYSRVSAHLMDTLEDEMELEEVPSSIIPVIDGMFISHIDNYGNIKTTITHEDLKGKYQYDDQVKIVINNVERQARYVNNLFGGVPGELVIYPGSSGQKDNPYLEISVWRHFTEEDKTTGIHAFNNPQPGAEIKIVKGT